MLRETAFIVAGTGVAVIVAAFFFAICGYPLH